MAYPAALDTFTTKVDGAGNTILAAHMNAVQTALVNTETELGTDPAGSATDVKTRLAVSLADDGDFRLTGSSTLTISGGVITATNNLHKVDTEAAASTDTLDTINGGADGYVLILCLANAARVVTVSHNTGNILCARGKSIVLSTDNDIVMLVYSSALSKWRTFGNPYIEQTALTTQLTTITATAPGTPDYAIQDLTNSSGYGFVTSDEGQSFLKVVLNLQTRVGELETKLQTLDFLA
jgi:hypothetical protein